MSQEIRKAKKHLRKCSTSLVIREMQSKKVLWDFIRKPKIKKITGNKCWMLGWKRTGSDLPWKLASHSILRCHASCREIKAIKNPFHLQRPQILMISTARYTHGCSNGTRILEKTNRRLIGFNIRRIGGNSCLNCKSRRWPEVGEVMDLANLLLPFS